MGPSQYHPASLGRQRCNDCRTIGVKKLFKQRQTWAARIVPEREGQMRDGAGSELSLRQETVN